MEDFIGMIRDRIFVLYEEHDHAEEYYGTTEDLTQLAKKHLGRVNINDYAMQVFGKLTDREDVYMNHGKVYGVQESINNLSYHLRNSKYSISAVMVNTLEQFEYFNF